MRSVRTTSGRAWLAGLLSGAAVLTAGGCGLFGSGEPSPSLYSVERDLNIGAFDRALQRLDYIENEGRLSEAGRAQASLLRAEIAIAAGHPSSALELVEPAFEHPALYSAANEIQGKAMIRLTRYAEAAESLANAESAYELLEDKLRAANLKYLARGLDAHAQGDFATARADWAQIRDVRLRRAIEEYGVALAAVDNRELRR